MKKLCILVAALFFMSVLASAERLSPLEEQYGVNEATVREQAEIDWVRDNKVMIYDFYQRQNNYVRLLSDEKLAEILGNERSRKRVGIDDANISEYVEEVRKEREKLYNESSRPPSREERRFFPSVEGQRGLVTDANTPPKLDDEDVVECIRKNSYTLYDPFRRTNKWIGWISDEWLLKIVETESSVVPGQCRLS